jgi:hypothetical protein
MGLDMYLYAEKNISSYDYETINGQLSRKDNLMYDKVIESAGMESLPESEYGSATVTKCVMYWRKANAIHRWFVDNCQDGIDECQKSYVPREKLIELRDICRKVLENKVNTDMVMELLPPESGFFFGDTEVDEYYFSTVERTHLEITKLLESSPDNMDFNYQSSW